MTIIPPTPIRSQSAWLRQDLEGDQSWIHTLSRQELAELEMFASAAIKYKSPLFKLTRSILPCPNLSGKIKVIIDEIENGRGVVLLRGLDVSRYDVKTIKLIYWCLGVHLGRPIFQNARGDLIGHVRDLGKNYHSNNVRGYTTNSRIAPHCDSSDVVTLLCLQPAKSGGESLVVSSTSLFNKFRELFPDYLKYLFEGYHFDLRGEGATGKQDEVTFNRVPIFSFYQGKLSCRFNQKTIIDGQRKVGNPLSGDRLKAIKLFGELAEEEHFSFPMTFKSGDIQILNNHNVLHSRESFEDWAETNKKRNLLRIWLNLDKKFARPLAPEFSDRLNTGPRGGVAQKRDIPG